MNSCGNNCFPDTTQCLTTCPPPCEPCEPCEPCPPTCPPVCPGEKVRNYATGILEYICSPEACKVFQSHDKYPPVDSISPCLRRKRRNLNTLGSPVGLVKSSYTLKLSEIKPKEAQLSRIATYLKAFAKLYIIPEDEFNTAVMNDILKEGQLLYSESPGEMEPPTDEQRLIYTATEWRVKRMFDLDGYSFHIELGGKFYLPGQKPVLQQDPEKGPEPLPDLPLEKIRETMKGFFKEYRYCFVCLSNWYIFVWRARGTYFVMDFYGRRLDDFMSDRDNGVAMFICLKSIDNVIHLITKLSSLQPNDTFNLREMKVVRMVGLDGKTMSREYKKRVHQYKVINKDYAYLVSKLHLTLNRADPLRNRSALPVAVGAMIATKIDHPATWNTEMLDNIICYGVMICQTCWQQCLHTREQIALDEFPRHLKIGQFYARFTFGPNIAEGVWKCVPNYDNTVLVNAIEQCFEEGANNLLLQIDHQMYAIWKKNNFIYFLDPYRHRVIADKSEGSDFKSATLRMIGSNGTFFEMLNQLLLETNKTTNFYIHRFMVTELSLYDNSSEKNDCPEVEMEAEVKSLNETICFELDKVQCADALGEISDYEEDDVISGIVDLDQKESKSETEEEDVEEEEEGALEDLGEYESSSSDDGKPGRPHGHKPGRPHGQKPHGHKPGKPHGQKPEKPSGHKPGKPHGQKPEKPSGHKPGKPHGQKPEKPSGHKPGKPPGHKPGDPSDDELDKPSGHKPGKPPGHKPGKPSGHKPDKPSDGKPESPSDGKPEKPSDGKPEKPSDGKPERPSDGKPEKPSDGKPERPSDGKPERPSDGKPGRPSGEGEGKPGKPPGTGRPGSSGHHGPGSSSSQGHGEGGEGGEEGTEDDDDVCAPCYHDRDLVCKPNSYPGYCKKARDMAVVGSENGSYDSICKLLRAGFKCADRVLTMTPWGNYVVFRGFNMLKKIYFLFDGCTCNVDRFRHLDLNCGTAGLLCFRSLHDVIRYIIDSCKIRTTLRKCRKNIVDEICREYCPN